jgi:hypothetical protein
MAQTFFMHDANAATNTAAGSETSSDKIFVAAGDSCGGGK